MVELHLDTIMGDSMKLFSFLGLLEAVSRVVHYTNLVITIFVVAGLAFFTGCAFGYFILGKIELSVASLLGMFVCAYVGKVLSLGK